MCEHSPYSRCKILIKRVRLALVPAPVSVILSTSEATVAVNVSSMNKRTVEWSLRGCYDTVDNFGDISSNKRRVVLLCTDSWYMLRTWFYVSTRVSVLKIPFTGAVDLAGLECHINNFSTIRTIFGSVLCRIEYSNIQNSLEILEIGN